MWPPLDGWFDLTSASGDFFRLVGALCGLIYGLYVFQVAARFIRDRFTPSGDPSLRAAKLRKELQAELLADEVRETHWRPQRQAQSANADDEDQPDGQP
ncbi:MAG: hypothetical protein AAGI71_10645 [Bacteroidota bacterium]